MQQQAGGLPAGYTELEYLESSGTQYIIIPEPFVLSGTAATSSGILLDLEESSTRKNSSNAWAFRVYNNNDTSSWIISLAFNLNYSTGVFSISYNGRNSLNQNHQAPCVCYYNYLGDNKRRIVDAFEEVQAPVYYPQWGTMTQYLDRITLFCMDNVIAGSMDNFSILRIKRGEVSQGSEITRDLVPILDADGTPCMFDKISKQRFYNSGTGTFGYRVKTTGAESAPFALRDPYYTPPSGVYARLIAENTLDILADTDIAADAAEQAGYTWHPNTGDAYTAYDITPEPII